MEPDQRAAFRSTLRRDAAALLPQPHQPTDEYRTAEDLREAWAEVTADGYGLPPGTDIIAPPPEQIYACPLCLHDW